MTELEIIKHLYAWADELKHPFQFHNSWIYKWECDFWTCDANGVTREFEIKTGRQDYFNDSKKEKHKLLSEGANYFYYVCPTNLIKSSEVEKKYGLIYVDTGGTVTVVKNPRKLHEGFFCNWKMIAEKAYWKWLKLWNNDRRAKLITRDEFLTGFENTTEEDGTNAQQ